MAMSMGTAAIIAGGGLLGGALGRNSGGSVSSNSTNHSYSWMSEMMEPIITDYVNNGGTNINWVNQGLAGLTPAEQEALDYMTSGTMQANGQKAFGWGQNAAAKGIGMYSDLLHGDSYFNKANYMSDIGSVYHSADDFIANQTKNATDQIMVDYGNTSANIEQQAMGMSSAYTSGAANAHSAAAISADNSIESAAAQISANVLGASTGLVTNAYGTGINLYTNGAQGAIGLGEQAMKSGANAVSKGWHNEMNAGLFEQYMNQQMMNNDRYNQMMSGNMGTINQMITAKMLLPWMNMDRTSETHTESKQDRHGIFG